MSVDEQSRHQLHTRLEEVLGRNESATLMSYLPPVGWADVATKRDLEVLRDQIDARFESMGARFDARFASIDARFESMEARFDGRFESVDAGFGSMENKLLATFRHEMVMQTRTIIFALIGTVVSMAALVFGAGRLA